MSRLPSTKTTAPKTPATPRPRHTPNFTFRGRPRLRVVGERTPASVDGVWTVYGTGAQPVNVRAWPLGTWPEHNHPDNVVLFPGVGWIALEVVLD